jgi:hypothetical protein
MSENEHTKYIKRQKYGFDRKIVFVETDTTAHRKTYIWHRRLFTCESRSLNRYNDRRKVKASKQTYSSSNIQKVKMSWISTVPECKVLKYSERHSLTKSPSLTVSKSKSKIGRSAFCICSNGFGSPNAAIFDHEKSWGIAVKHLLKAAFDKQYKVSLIV